MRTVLNRDAKINIAKTVAKMIPDHSAISIGLGTTVEFVASALLGHNNLKIYTNSLVIAQILSANDSFEIHVSSGRMRNDSLDIVGGAAEEFFERYNVDFGIFGVAGVDEHGSMLDFAEEEVRVRNKIRHNSRHSILVVDSLKFTRNAHVRGGKINQMDTVISDELPPQNILDLCAESATKFIAVK